MDGPPASISGDASSSSASSAMDLASEARLAPPAVDATEPPATGGLLHRSIIHTTTITTFTWCTGTQKTPRITQSVYTHQFTRRHTRVFLLESRRLKLEEVR